jgi:putative ABC transport system permease protein
MAPALLRWILSALGPSALREELLEELDLGYRERLETRGRASAFAWGLRQVFSFDWFRLRRELREDLMNSFLQDVRYAFRSLLRRPGFTAVVVATLGLGIGVNVALMSVVRAVLLKPLPYGGEERIVSIWSQWDRFPKTWVSIPEYRTYRDTIESFDQVALYGTGSGNLTEDEPERVGVAQVTPNLFEVFGVEAALGRTFTSEEAQITPMDSNADPAVVLLSNRLWQRRYGSDPEVVGRRVELDGAPVTVIGVLPEGFQLPVDFSASTRTDLYFPGAVPEGLEPIPNGGGSHGYFAAARLRGGASTEDASSEVLLFNQRATADDTYSQQMRFRTLVIPVAEDVAGDVRTALWILAGAVGFVLLMACGNVANLLLSRAQERRREIALRSSLGAGSLRIFRQLMTESLVIAVLGGLTALLLAHLGLAALKALEPGSIPRLSEARLDLAALGFALAVTLVTSILFGLVPAHAATRIRSALSEASRGSSGSRGSQRFRFVLLGLQIAMAVVLVAGAGLMIRTFANLMAIDPGFRSDGVLTLRLSTPEASYPEAGAVVSFWDRLFDEVNAMSAVESTGAARILPLATQIGDWGIQVEGYVPAPDENPAGDWQIVTPGYIETIGMSLLEGRSFTDADRADSEPVVLVNEALARKYLSEGSALGRSVGIGGRDGARPTRVVGVVRSVRHNGVTAEVKPGFFVPLAQAEYAHGFTPRSMTLAIRTSAAPETLLPEVRRIIAALDPKMPIAEVRTLEDVVAGAVAPSRFTMALLVAFSALALLLACVGVYGVVSYVVSQRRSEIGIRMALGASRSSVFAFVGTQVAIATGVGVLAGCAAALVATSSMGAVLHGVRPTDPLTFATVPLVLFATALAGSLIPALRATRVDPVSTLRSE